MDEASFGPGSLSQSVYPESFNSRVSDQLFAREISDSFLPP